MHTRGLSLVELVVVITIIGMLGALLLPGISFMRSRAETVQCGANLRNIGQMIHLYTVDNDGYYPAVSPYNSGVGDWIPAVMPYASAGLDASWSSLEKVPGLMVCPTQKRLIQEELGTDRAITHCYAMNYTLGLNKIPLVTKKRSVATVPYASTTILVTAGGYNRTSTVDSLQPYYIVQGVTFKGEYLGGIHHGANNVLWCDGHVSSVSDIMQLNPTGTSSGYGVGSSIDKYWSPGYDYR